MHLAGVPVVPLPTRQVDLASRHARLHDWCDEQVPTEEVLVIELEHGRVVLVVEDQGRCTGAPVREDSRNAEYR